MSKEVNQPDSINDVLKTVSHVLLEFEEMVRVELPNTAITYDENLSYESGMKLILSNDNYQQNNTDPLPAFIYNRTIVVDSDKGLGKRTKNKIGCIRVGDNVARYGFNYGEFDIQFLYVAKSIEFQEKFEASYLADEGISGEEEIELEYPEFGKDEYGIPVKFKYFLEPNELTEKTIEDDGVYYKGIVGSIKVRGFFFTFKDEVGGLIKEINQRIYSTRTLGVKEELIGDCTIT